MAYNAEINPQSGKSSSSIVLKLTTESKETRVRVENATHLVNLDEFTLSPHETETERPLSLKIPEQSSDAMITIFVNFEEKDKDGQFELVKIIPLIYSIKDETATTDLFDISPTFVGQQDTCKISVKGEPSDRYVISINDKRFNIIVNPSGLGTFNFKTKDVLVGDSEEIAHKFPMYYYSSSDNYIKKSFTGCYVNVVPNDIKAAAVDPRCETYNPLTFTIPSWCLENPPEVTVNSVSLQIPCNEIPVIHCDYDECGTTCPCEIRQFSIAEDACRIHKSSSTLISNGMVLNSYISVDKSILPGSADYNFQTVFIKDTKTSLEAQIAAAENVTVLPKAADEDITIYVTEEIYNKVLAILDNSRSAIVVFIDEDLQYQKFTVSEAVAPDEYGTPYSLIVDRASSNITISELKPCVYAIFYEYDPIAFEMVAPTVLLPSNIQKLPLVSIEGSEGTVNLTATNVSVSSNSHYKGLEGESFVHIVAEAYYLGKIQLFYYGFSVGPSGYTSTNSDSWSMLTTDGINKNVKTVADQYNNLHIFWESDRTGLSQIYYGVIGPSSVFYSNATISSIIDKKVELNNKAEKPFGYLSQNIIESTGQTLSRISEQGVIDEYTGLTHYPNEGIVSTAWIKNITNNGEVSVDDFEDVSNISVSSSTLSDTAAAFTTLDRDAFFDLSSGLLSQINYQVSFGFNGDISQDISTGSSLLSEDDIDALYETFKAQYVQSFDSDVAKNLPFYTLSDNRFTIGRDDNIYDRFVPLVGSYKNADLQGYTEGQTVASNFEIIASGVDRNLNHYFIAVVPEKVRFKASNLEDLQSYQIRMGKVSGYNPEDTQEYYTGRAALAVVYTTDDYLFGSEVSNTTVRNISKFFVLSETTQIDVLVNYSKTFSEDSNNYLNAVPGVGIDYPRFVCSLSVMVNGGAVFSESFLVDLSDKYRTFDIGLGVTSKGSFQADAFYPYNSSVFEDAFVNFNYSNVTISSPTYQINNDVATIPSSSREQLSLSSYDFYGNEEDEIEKFFNNYSLLFEGDTVGYVPVDDPSTGVVFDIETQAAFSLDDFMQIPITLEGVNSNPSVSLDFINNVHLTWQSNRDKNWNILYSSSLDKNLPFRFDTHITDTESNSLSPDVAADSSGRRMIVWHDDREGNFNIYAARTLQSPVSSDALCEAMAGEQFSPTEITSTLDQDTNSVVSFSQSNTDPSGGNLNLHFRVTFYSDASRERVIYSAFSLTENRRWYVKGDSYGSLNNNGLTLAFDETVEVFYVPDIYPQQLFGQQSIISEGESPLLSGVKYYIDIESIDMDTSELNLISSEEFEFNTSDVETNFWRENLDSNNWICSAQGQDDLLAMNSGDQSTFPSIDSNLFNSFYIACQSLRDSSTTIARSIWDANNDVLYGSGQGFWETDSPFQGLHPQVITDQGQSYYINSTDDTEFYYNNCPLPMTPCGVEPDPSSASFGSGFETRCEPGTLTEISNEFVMRVYEQDVTGSLVINRDDVVSVIEKTNINVDISGIYGAYAVRFRNQGGGWSNWVDVNDSIFIENGRFVAPWSVPRVNGLRHLCCQVLTVYGITDVKCIDVFVNMATVDYVVEYFYDEDMTDDVSERGGFALLATKGEETVNIYAKVIFNEAQTYSSLKFDIINQGISGIFDYPLTPKGEESPYFNYLGKFAIRKEDGVYDKDGIGFLKVKFPGEDTTDECFNDKRDLYNQMLISSELDFIEAQSQTPEEAFREEATRTVSKVLDINGFKQYYDSDDPNFLFGDAGFYRN